MALRVDDARAGREFLRRLTPHVDSVANWWSARNVWLSVGISYAGLEALGVSQEWLQSFPEAFRVGMAVVRGASHVVMVSNPKAVAAMIERAATELESAVSS